MRRPAPHNQVKVCDLRILDDFVDRMDRREWNVVAGESFGPVRKAVLREALIELAARAS